MNADIEEQQGAASNFAKPFWDKDLSPLELVFWVVVLSVVIGAWFAASWHWEHIGGYIGLALFALVVVALFSTWKQCPKCRRRKALEATGRSRTEEHISVSVDCTEHRCRYCGHVEWRREYDSGE